MKNNLFYHAAKKRWSKTDEIPPKSIQLAIVEPYTPYVYIFVDFPRQKQSNAANHTLDKALKEVNLRHRPTELNFISFKN
jgi:hypothetical protein